MLARNRSSRCRRFKPDVYNLVPANRTLAPRLITANKTSKHDKRRKSRLPIRTTSAPR